MKEALSSFYFGTHTPIITSPFTRYFSAYLYLELIDIDHDFMRIVAHNSQLQPINYTLTIERNEIIEQKHQLTGMSDEATLLVRRLEQCTSYVITLADANIRKTMKVQTG